MNEQIYAQVVAKKLTEELTDTVNVYVTDTTTVGKDVRCPHCGESYYMENYSTSTCLYCPPIYKDGVNINPDRNTSTTHCTCMNCGKEFSVN